MTDRGFRIPNTRSPGTPVCHPNDEYEPLNTEPTNPRPRPAHTCGGEYIELHAASAFSFLEGASQPEGLIERAVELEMPAMALEIGRASCRERV